MKTFTNNSKISLPLAVWLCDDDYDYNNTPNTISATTLLKPMRQIVLAIQNKELDKIVDIEQLVASRMGTALHTAIETTWLKEDKVRIILSQMGFSESVVKRILINPTPEQVKEDTIAVYMENRSSKKVGKYTISGKYDFVIEGRLKDFKSTKVYGYIKGSNKDNYIKQGSIYRWLNPEIILDDIIDIEYIFTDWNMLEYIRNKDTYPNNRLLRKEYPLMSIEETQTFVEGVCNKIESLEDKAQSELPLCTKDELWMDDSVYKYYKDPTKMSRSTKNFDNAADAHEKCASAGVGIVVEVKGKPRRCKWCDVVLICDQAKTMIADGSLVL